MSTYTNLPIARRLLLANTAISNALSDPEMIGLLTPYTYDETKLQEELSLYQEVEALHHSTFTERGEKIGATSDLHDRWSESRGLLRDKIARARIALRGNTGAIRILKLDQPRAQRQADWIIQARQFYTAALGNQDILDALDTMNISQQDMQDGLDAVNAFDEALRQRTKESGDAQDAVHARNEALATLDQWMRDFRDISRVALRDRPQLIERLGFLERGN